MAVIENRCFKCIRLVNVQGVLFILLFIASAISATPNGCDSANLTANVDWLKDITLPEKPVQGSICDLSCCGPEAEGLLSMKNRNQVERFARDSISQVVSLLQTRSRKLEELFKEMMIKSKKEFHSMFQRTYGVIYLENSAVFSDFFVELDRYYNHGGISLTETMDHFFTILYQRMFKVINAQYNFNEEYLACIAKDISNMKPFGDVPGKLAVLLKRSFVATRIFHKALNKGSVIAERMLKINISEECGMEITKMHHCDSCTNNAGPGACNAYCTDTLKSCLYMFAELDKNWNKYIDGLDKVAEKLLGPFNIEVVVEPINIKISEAIMNFQENGSEVSNKVFVECGEPDLKKNRKRRQAESEDLEGEVTYQPIKFNSKKKHKKTNSMMKQSPMEKRISEVKQKVKETRNFWSHLPYQFCNNITTASPSEEESCWNGTHLGAYFPKKHEPVFNKPSVLFEQIYALGVVENKLRAAYQGQDEELIDEDEDDEPDIISGSASGDTGTEIDDFDIDPTTTTTTTTTTERILSNDINKDFEDEEERVAAASASDLTKAMIHYILPIVMVWFGGTVADIL
ncbi:PREDICTED: glypican-6 [Nicrophorus vespilloides]|uniref:Glypican-6 n=1 Tax=Nicrophorus vespilloides TaxID=110193 RepID=A0ABM1M8I8_NICVS|nr:PREDICTED: glypican-6 [Nicrophorus vespilloides]